jgi:hypothetical protein
MTTNSPQAIRPMAAHRQAGFLRPRPETVTVTLTIAPDKVEKLHAFMASDTWEKAEAARKANLEGCIDSLEHAVKVATTHYGTSGGRTFAAFLASLYNGDRVKVDASSIMSLDSANFEHLLNILRLRFESHREPHQFFENGGELFERMIEDWGLGARRRKS